MLSQCVMVFSHGSAQTTCGERDICNTGVPFSECEFHMNALLTSLYFLYFCRNAFKSRQICLLHEAWQRGVLFVVADAG
jgi:hypothetical protein